MTVDEIRYYYLLENRLRLQVNGQWTDELAKEWSALCWKYANIYAGIPQEFEKKVRMRNDKRTKR